MNERFNQKLSIFKEAKEGLFTKTHIAYRNYILDQTIKRVYLCTVIFAIYAALLYTVIKCFVPNFLHQSSSELVLLFWISILGMIVNFIFSKTKIYYKKSIWLDHVIFLLTAGYIGWSIFCFYMSIHEGRDANYLTLLIVITGSMTLFSYNLPQFVMLYIYTACVLSFCVNGSLSLGLTEYTFDRNIIYNLIFLITFLFVFGVVKYVTTLVSYKNLCDSNEYYKELQESHNIIETNFQQLQFQNDTLRQMSVELQQTNEAQRKFTRAMNHELRNPINGVLGCLQMLQSDPKMEEEQLNLLQNAHYSASLLMQIVNDLVDYQKMESGELSILVDDFCLHDVIESAKQVYYALKGDKQLDLQIHIDGNAPVDMNGDGFRIGQIMNNLVSNATKYTQQGNIDVYIDVKESHLYVKVQDTGEGFDTSHPDDLFKPYKRFNEEEHKSIQGTGLGLAIIKQLVDKMKGTISVESVVGEGTTFTVDIPVTILEGSKTYQQALDRTLAQSETSDQTQIHIDFSDKHILYADDSSVNLLIFQGLLKPTGIQITTVENGQLAVDLLKAGNTYDIIFLDHMMAVMDGVEAFREMKKMGVTTPTYILTGNMGDEYDKTYKEEGFKSKLCKPVNKDELINAIQSV